MDRRRLISLLGTLIFFVVGMFPIFRLLTAPDPPGDVVRDVASTIGNMSVEEFPADAAAAARFMSDFDGGHSGMAWVDGPAEEGELSYATATLTDFDGSITDVIVVVTRSDDLCLAGTNGPIATNDVGIWLDQPWDSKLFPCDATAIVKSTPGVVVP
jgi:hypothetical protein